MWKQHLYSFLLRRVLGPLLTPESNRKLNASLDVSEGRIVLSNTVELNAAYVSQFTNGVEVVSAVVENLEIQLSLEEEEHGVSNSWVWRAWRLGRTTTETSSSVSLVAHVIVDGLCLRVKSCPLKEKAAPNNTKDETQSVLSSYIAAALASLQVNIQFNNTKVKVVEDNDDHWMELRVQAVSYQDAVWSERALQRSLEVTRVSVLAGHGEVSTTVALVDGTSRVTVVLHDESDSCEEDSKPPLIRQEVEVVLEKCNFSVCAASLVTLKEIAQSFVNQRKQDPLPSAVGATPSWILASADDDERDLATIDALVKQYQEARLLVERKEIRGGILVPATEESGMVTFDTFFDANEFKASRYASVHESVFLHNTTPKEWVHTTFHFLLREGGIKLSFEPEENQQQSEYVLLTVGDIDVSSRFSRARTEYSMSIGQFEVENSHVVVDETGDGKNIEIGTLLRFRQDGLALEESDLDGSEGSGFGGVEKCIELQSNTDHGDREDTSIVELDLQPIELAYYMTTAKKIAGIIERVGRLETPDLDEHDGGIMIAEESEARTKLLKVAISCDFIELSLPLPSDNTEWSALYDRCGYTSGSGLMRKPCFGITLDRCNLELNQQEGRDILFKCNSIIGFASAPKIHNTFSTGTKRVDIFGICGRDEVEPHIPLCIELKTGFTQRDLSSFPKVKPISSFKTRQADEDEDIDSEIQDVSAESTMISNAEKCTLHVSARIPEIMIDLSTPEVQILSSMAEALSLQTPQNDPVNDTESYAESPGDAVSISLDCGLLSLVVRDDEIDDESFSLVSVLDRLRIHCCLEGHSLRHLRFLVHEFDVYEGLCPSGQRDQADSSCTARVVALRDRSLHHSDCYMKPVLHRSHLFAPMSQNSPSIQIDVVCQPFDESIEYDVHVNVYDTTYRWDYDSSLFESIQSLLSQLRPRKSVSTSPPNEVQDSPRTLTRFFLAITDCNFDHTSSTRFNTASRLIARIGDFRASSNVLTPREDVQAGNISIGDVALYLCNRRFPYFFENSSLPQAHSILNPDDRSVASIALADQAEPEEVWRVMNNRLLLSLDSSSVRVVMNPATSEEPPLCLTLSAGEVCLFACKDSFALFNGTVGEVVEEISALTEPDIERLRQLSVRDNSCAEKEEPTEEPEVLASLHDPLDDLRKKSVLRPAFGVATHKKTPDFLLDGYDWTTIDADEQGQASIPPGEEQASRWYGDPTKADNPKIDTKASGDLSGSMTGSTESLETFGPSIVSHHFAMNQIADPLSAGDMGVGKLVGPGASALIKSRTIVKELSVKLRFFDGYDWPELMDSEARRSITCDGAFLIPEVRKATEDNETSTLNQQDKSQNTRKAQLMGDLLQDETKFSTTFQSVPLPEERSRRLIEQAEFNRLARRSGKYFQVAASGVSLRTDSLVPSTDHRLSNCTNIRVSDFFLAETISGTRPVKMIGEWLNVDEHPRDYNSGLVMVKMVTFHPLCRVSPGKEVVVRSDETELALQLLPLRCLLDQRAISFARAFFSSNESDDSAPKRLPPGRYTVPPPLFTSFRVHPLKLKVDYWPQKLDSRALRDGAIVELINLNSIDGMVLTLQQVEVSNEVGIGSVVSILVGRWVRDICSTQLLKFVTKARPLEPITALSGAASDMVVLPWEAFRNGESIQKALRSGVKSLSKTVAYELFSVTSKAAQFVAGGASRAPGDAQILPSRPVHVPRNVVDAAPHAVESLTRGLQAANYKIVIIPYREYQRNGASGAAKSIVRGIPVALAAPASGAAEALSYALMGARNQVRPDIRKEEEASIQGLHFDC